jgi:GT2 family glycosyltransferase
MAAISVVIATYNRAPLLRAAIHQLRKQQFLPGDEVIIVDNGSTDDTANVLASATRELPVTLRVLNESVKGKGPALAAGLAAATGDILALTDDDVLVADDWIGRIRRVFSDPVIALVGGRVDPNWEAAPPEWLSVQEEDCYGTMASPLALLHYGHAQELGPRTAVGANLAIRRTVLQALGGVRPDLARRSGSLFGVEDQELCHRVQRAGYRCVYRPGVCVKHWVPKERLRLGYYSRWFFWSGYGNALLGTDDGVRADGQRQPVTAYFFRHAIAAFFSAIALLLRHRTSDAAKSGMEVFYGAGYVAQRISTRFARYGRRRTACLIAIAALFAPTTIFPKDRVAPRSSIRSLRCHRIRDDVLAVRPAEFVNASSAATGREGGGGRSPDVRSCISVGFSKSIERLSRFGRAHNIPLSTSMNRMAAGGLIASRNASKTIPAPRTGAIGLGICSGRYPDLGWSAIT